MYILTYLRFFLQIAGIIISFYLCANVKPDEDDEEEDEEGQEAEV